AQHRTVVVPFDQPGDDALAFSNANTLAELKQLEDY
ncbi:MAG: molybdenum cofactor guanylyltransferase MobA, partial [bacterium]